MVGNWRWWYQLKGWVGRASDGDCSVRFARRCHRKELEVRVEGTADSAVEKRMLVQREFGWRGGESRWAVWRRRGRSGTRVPELSGGDWGFFLYKKRLFSIQDIIIYHHISRIYHYVSCVSSSCISYIMSLVDTWYIDIFMIQMHDMIYDDITRLLENMIPTWYHKK